MIDVFNSTFEISLRMLLVLKSVRCELSIDKILLFDYLATYGKEFGVSTYNLHGENNYRFSELAAKRNIMNSAVKDLVLKGYVIPCYSKKGFLYKISDVGITFCDSLNNVYATEYLSNISNVIERFSNYTDIQLSAFIRQHAISMFGGND